MKTRNSFLPIEIANPRRSYRFAYTEILFTAGVLSVSGQSGININTPKPNVVFIICDDLNDYPLPFGGYARSITPNIDRLAEAGVLFVNNATNRPISAPSRNSLFTGVYPHHSQDFGWTKQFEHPVLKNNKTLMEYFTKNGYYVMGSGKLLHFDRKGYYNEWGVDVNNYGPFAFNGTEQVGHPSVPEPFRSNGPVDGSFAPLSDVPFGQKADSAGNKRGWIYSAESGRFLNYVDENNRDLMPDEMHAEWAVRRIKEMSNKENNSPFAMFIGFVKPHTPLHAPKRFFDMFPLEKIELSPILKGDADDTYYRDFVRADIKGLKYYRTLKESYGGNEEAGLKKFVQAYLACLAFVDEQIGKVVDAINESRFKENTIIVFTSDNGWQMGEKDYLFKDSPWEESIRLPLIIKVPGFKGNTRVDHPVSLIDLWPTLADFCGLTGDNRKNEAGATIDGFSLRPFIEDPNSTKWMGPNGALTVVTVGNSSDIFKHTYSYRTKDWRYIRYPDGREELYNQIEDPYEWENLAGNKAYYSRKEMLKNEMMELIDRHRSL